MKKNSFIRNDKINLFQKDTIINLFPIYSIKHNNMKIINLNEIFKNDNKNVLEIGFGNGENLIHMAVKYPNINFIGVELYKKGICNLLINIHLFRLNNLKIIYKNVNNVLNNVSCKSLYGVHVLFPDPWHKKKHNKRRLISNKFLFFLSNVVKKNGFIHIATDISFYFFFIISLFFKNKYYLIPKKLVKKTVIFKKTKYQNKVKNSLFFETIMYKK